MPGHTHFNIYARCSLPRKSREPKHTMCVLYKSGRWHDDYITCMVTTLVLNERHSSDKMKHEHQHQHQPEVNENRVSVF